MDCTAAMSAVEAENWACSTRRAAWALVGCVLGVGAGTGTVAGVGVGDGVVLVADPGLSPLPPPPQAAKAVAAKSAMTLAGNAVLFGSSGDISGDA